MNTTKQIDNHIRQLSPHMMKRDGVILLCQARAEIDRLTDLIKDIKAWDVANYMSLPHPIRVRIQEILND